MGTFGFRAQAVEDHFGGDSEGGWLGQEIREALIEPTGLLSSLEGGGKER